LRSCSAAEHLGEGAIDAVVEADVVPPDGDDRGQGLAILVPDVREHACPRVGAALGEDVVAPVEDDGPFDLRHAPR
jgi:hypothetical protein